MKFSALHVDFNSLSVDSLVWVFRTKASRDFGYYPLIYHEKGCL